MPTTIPLAARLRPRKLEDFKGQAHLLSPGKSLHRAITQGRLPSMILWGPPGTGKTTLARLLADSTQCRFEHLSAVSAGIKEIQAVLERARISHQEKTSQVTILFVDEIHRFNKTQQDTLLPAVEEGIFTLMGATTENPSFSLNNALLSRVTVYTLKPLSLEEIAQVLDRAVQDTENGLGTTGLILTPSTRQHLTTLSDGDARRALNLLEAAAEFAEGDYITEGSLQALATTPRQRFDKQGDFFYEQISALHKSIRGSDPDAALYWLARLLEGGCDPLYLARRMVRMASEDIGNADPGALTLALNVWQVQERLGQPEGAVALAQAVVYLACAPKSNAVYTAFKAAQSDAQKQGSLAVPLHLRNAPTPLMQQLGYGKGYRYAHDEPEAYAKGVQYFPEELGQQQYYFPVDRGVEIQIGEKLRKLRKLARDSIC